jgi:tetratricopeptide (TPR) repeat protein
MYKDLIIRILRNKLNLFTIIFLFNIIFIHLNLYAMFYPAKKVADIENVLDNMIYSYENNDTSSLGLYALWNLEYYFYASKTHSEKFWFLLNYACDYEEKKYKRFGGLNIMLGDSLLALSKCYQIKGEYDKAFEYLHKAIDLDTQKLQMHYRGENEKNQLFLTQGRLERMLLRYEVQKAILYYLQGNKELGNKIARELLQKIGYTHKNASGEIKKDILFYLAITRQYEGLMDTLESASQEHYMWCRAIWGRADDFLQFVDNLLLKDLVEKYPKRIQRLKEIHIEYGKKDSIYGKKPIPNELFRTDPHPPECTDPTQNIPEFSPVDRKLKINR